MIKECEKIN